MIFRSSKYQNHFRINQLVPFAITILQKIPVYGQNLKMGHVHVLTKWNTMTIKYTDEYETQYVRVAEPPPSFRNQNRNLTGVGIVFVHFRQIFVGYTAQFSQFSVSSPFLFYNFFFHFNIIVHSPRLNLTSYINVR